MINDRPPRGLLSWNTCEKDEPRKGAHSVDVNVWVPKEIVRKGIFAIAGYLERQLGWSVHRHGGWGGGGLMLGDDEWTIVYVKVRAREIKAALAEGKKGMTSPQSPPPDVLPRAALVHDLAIVLAGSLHRSAKIGPSPLLAACRLRDVLGIADGETVKSIERRLRSAFGEDAGS